MVGNNDALANDTDRQSYVHPFKILINASDERICLERAEETMKMHQNLKIDILPDLPHVYSAADSILSCNAQQYLCSLPQTMEASKQQATENWLKGLHVIWRHHYP